MLASTPKKKIATVIGVTCFVYYFFPVLAFNVIPTNEVVRKILYADYYIFSLPKWIYITSLMLITSNVIKAVIIQFIFFLITWWGVNALYKLFFLKK